VPNELILANLRRAAERCAVVVRIPIVPGSNDDDDNILATARFAASLGGGLERIELLPYHKLGVDVYRRLGQRYRLEHVEPPGDNRVMVLKRLVESCGVPVRIGG
jgi:pyruvate formate lyase activating enzyme